jgi:hypothetical protein
MESSQRILPDFNAGFGAAGSERWSMILLRTEHQGNTEVPESPDRDLLSKQAPARKSRGKALWEDIEALFASNLTGVGDFGVSRVAVDVTVSGCVLLTPVHRLLRPSM